MNAALIEKIKKLLALAGSPNPHEAELALQMAQRIALENEIDLEFVRKSSNEAEDDIAKDTLAMGKRLPFTLNYATTIVTKHFNVKIISSGKRESGRYLYFIGKKSDIEVAKHIFHYLSETMVRCWHEFYHSTLGITLQNKASYMSGFYVGVNAKLEANKAKIVQEQLQTAEAVSQYALMKVDQGKKIDKFVQSSFTGIRQTKSNHRAYYNEAYSQGKEDGSKFNVSRGFLPS